MRKIVQSWGFDVKRLAPEDNKNFLRGLGLNLHPIKHNFIFRAGVLIYQLSAVAGVRFSQQRDEIFFHFRDLTINIQTWEDIYILNEIFREGDYNIALPEPNCVVIDIGMNVGIASLFFATNSNVSNVYSFEPMEDTFQQALKNISLNPALRNKIHPKQKGIYSESKTLKIEYSYEWKGSVGIVPLDSFKGRSDVKLVDLPLLNVVDEFLSIKTQHPNQSLIIKIDCEGSEYSILEKLDQENYVGLGDAYLIEWHQRGPAPILQIFERNGFICLSKNPFAKDVGMIYAFKRNSLAAR